jgi:SAM-dependent methyltransferase
MTDASPDGLPLGSAESRSPEDFDQMYDGTPPWDIGRPQPVFLRLAAAGALSGRVLDAGCGTGEHVLMAAGRGLDATGIDAAPTAIAIAQRKAADRGLSARFLVWDALRLPELGEQFDTVLDSGLFHVFDDERRARYVEALTPVVRPDGRYIMCCFSDRQPGNWGPRRVRQDEIRAAFAAGWTVESIEPVEFDTTLNPPVAQAWLSMISRSGG